MTNYIKDPHATIFTGSTSCGKSHLVLELIENIITSILTTSLISAQSYDGIRHMLGDG